MRRHQMRAQMKFSFLLLFSFAYSATLYMGSGETYTDLQAAMAAMSSGDTLIIRDGTYAGASNMIDNSNIPPDGILGDYTVVMAENPGNVYFDGEATNNMVYVSTPTIDYVKFIGIIWHSSNTGNCVYIDDASYLWFQQCGFFDAGINAATSYTGLYLRYCTYTLVEDCYFYGEFYYGCTFLECDSSIMRRCVARKDKHRGTRGSNFTTYSSYDIEIQNCIAIDGDNNAAYEDVSSGLYALYNTNTNGGAARIHHRGNIVLNCQYFSGYVMETCVLYTFDNIVCWDTERGFFDRTSSNADGIYDHCLFGNNNPGIGWGAIIGAHTITNSIMVQNDTYGWEYGDPDLDYNCFYDNATNYGNSSHRGANDYCSENSNEINPFNNSLDYLLRIEAASELITAGESGARVGPNIEKRIGGTGVIWGEAGYNAETGVDLWPFPNEAIIKEHFSAYNDENVDSDRGFCATGETLTHYIWNYLGNGNPYTSELEGGESSPSTKTADVDSVYAQ